MTQKKQSKDTQNIINTYKVIYKTFFVFGNIIIATVASVGIRLFVQAKDNTIQISTNTKKTEEKSIETPIDTTDITIYKEQNSAIKNDINILYSDRNIIQYKGYTLPSHIRKKPQNIITQETIESGQYPISGLRKTIQEIILQEYNNPKALKEKLPPIQAHQEKSRKKVLGSTEETGANVSIKAAYDLKCMDHTIKISNHICEQYIIIAITEMTSYDLSKNHNEILDISRKIPKKLHKKMCNNLIEYTRKTGDTSGQMNAAIEKTCSTKEQEKYQKNISTISINQSIINTNKIPPVTDDSTINEYVIHSLLQNIHNNIKKNRIDTIGIQQYAHTWKKILKEQLPIGQFTYDSSYYINTQIILKTLSNDNITQGLEKKDIQKTIKLIKEINQGERTTPGIINHIANKLLKDEKNLTQNTNNIDTQEQEKEYQFYKEEKSTTTSTQIISSGTIAINHNKTPITFIKNRKTQLLIEIQSPTISNINSINTLIKTGQIKDIQGAEIFIQENRETLQTNNNINFCDMAQKAIKTEIKSCAENTIILTSKQNEQEITYKITTTKGGKITQIGSNSQHINNRIQEEEINLNTNMATIIPTIQKIITVPRNKTRKQTIQEQSGQGDKFLVIDKIKEFLGEKPKNVGQKGNLFVIGIEIQKNIYYAQYDVQTHTIHNIILPNITIEGKRVSVPEFRLPLTYKNAEEIKKFKENPISYIKKKYPSVATLYNNADKK